MSEEKKKRNKIVGISIGILVVLLVVISSTYAYWQITKSQDDPNSIVAACLNITMENQFGTLTPSKNYPISDADGLADSGFTFTVENHCKEDVAYIIGMDSVEVDTTGTNGYMQDGSIKVSVDNTTPRIYGTLEDIEHVEENDTYVIRTSKELNTATVKGNGSNTHVVKAWIDADAPLSENNKVFGGRVFITGGQFITDDNPIVQLTPESCFEMSGEEIIGYNKELDGCGENVTIPATVNNVAVKTIDTNAFKGESAISTFYNMSNEEITSFDKTSAIVAVVLENHEKGTEPDLANLLTGFDYAISYTDDTDTNSTIKGMVGERPLYYQNSTTQDFPGFKNNDLVIYMSDLSGTMLGMEHVSVSNYVEIKSLDLSQASSLEKIEDFAFSNLTSKITSLNDFENYPVSLTSLNFGNNEKTIEFGTHTFARIDVDELTMYSTYYVTGSIDYEDDIDYRFPFGGANIEKLTIKPTEEDTELLYVDASYTTVYSPLYMAMNVNNLVISEGITHISKYQFGNSKIGLISYPSTLDTIKNNGLESSTIVDTLKLPDTLTEIPANAFSTVYIKNINIPSSVITIGDGAFSCINDMICKGRYISFENTENNPSKLTQIGSSAFSAGQTSENKGDLIIPSTVTIIGDYAFKNSLFSSITFEDTTEKPSNLIEIGSGAFNGASVMLIDVTLPKSLTKIGSYGFPISGTLTFKGRSDLSGMTLGENWNSPAATIVFAP